MPDRKQEHERERIREVLGQSLEAHDHYVAAGDYAAARECAGDAYRFATALYAHMRRSASQSEEA